jgi:hypothetical protein
MANSTRLVRIQERGFSSGGCVVVILVPWKPVVVVWLVLSGVVLAGYVASSLMEGRRLIAPYGVHQEHAHHRNGHRPA